jgi:SAM-dependent methyltransferase
MEMESTYDDADAVAKASRQGGHREMIGGLWEELGQLQLDFLVAQGLRPEQTFLDVGCGSLRGGVKIIAHLDPGRYWGIDNNDVLLRAGWDEELGPAGLQSRQPREQLVALSDFQFDELMPQFDVAIAQSVFSHMSLNRIRRCLARLAPKMVRGGRLFATFFEVPSSADREQALLHEPGGISSHSDRDPYHYRLRDLEFAVEDLPWHVDYIGNWGHPRDQKMISFVRK